MPVKIAVLFAVAVLAASCTGQTYTTSSGKEFVSMGYYPKWSWDTVQEYKMFAHDTRLLTDDEVKRIAAMSNFICIEKQHGTKLLGGADLGTKHETARFKAVKPGIKVLFYFNGAVPYNFTTYTKNFAPKQNKMTEQKKKDLFIFDTKKNEYSTGRNRHTYAYDILKPTFRKWWSDTVAHAVRNTGTDGVFWDQMHGWSWLRHKKGPEIVEAHITLEQLTTRAMGKGKILLCNNAAHNKDFIKNCDAVMYEHYGYEARYRKNLNRYITDWEQMRRVADAGKMNIYRMPVNLKGTKYEKSSRRELIAEKNHPELAKTAKQRVEFPLACFLIGAQPHSYFMLSWGWCLHTGALVDFPEMNKPLGPPQGAYKRQSKDKWIFTRKFKHADVWVDLEKEQAKITWK
ncbi:MAG: hypothetical protein GY794_07635 [bacterium]|nr:hypothetical protein [bacterium]